MSENTDDRIMLDIPTLNERGIVPTRKELFIFMAKGWKNKVNEIQRDLWDCYHDLQANEFIGITTNNFVKKDGKAVMGRGCALEATKKFPHIASDLGALIHANGKQAYVFPAYRVVTFPVKHVWNEQADLGLIEQSCTELKDIMHVYGIKKIFLPRPGCGNGGLKWDLVKPIIEKHFGNDDRLVIVSKVGE